MCGCCPFVLRPSPGSEPSLVSCLETPTCGQVQRQRLLLPGRPAGATRCARSAQQLACRSCRSHSPAAHVVSSIAERSRTTGQCVSDGSPASLFGACGLSFGGVSSTAATFGVISALNMPAQIQCFFAQVRPNAPLPHLHGRSSPLAHLHQDRLTTPNHRHQCPPPSTHSPPPPPTSAAGRLAATSDLVALSPASCARTRADGVQGIHF